MLVRKRRANGYNWMYCVNFVVTYEQVDVLNTRWVIEFHALIDRRAFQQTDGLIGKHHCNHMVDSAFGYKANGKGSTFLAQFVAINGSH